MRKTHVFVTGIVLFALSADQAASQDTEQQLPAADHGPGEADAWSDTYEPDGHESQAQFGIEVHCRALNDFGYVATAHGTLAVSSRKEPSVLALGGALQVTTNLYGDTEYAREIKVQGTVDIFGGYMFGDVLSGADDLSSVFFAFAPNASSWIEAKDTTQYQTECSGSSVKLPRVADLAPLKTLRFSAAPDGRQRVELDVRNVGNASVTGPEVRVRLMSLDLTGTLYAAGAVSNTLEGGTQGYIELYVPANTLTRCADYAAILDLDHTLQSGDLDPYADDSTTFAAPCLRWNTPITDDTLGAPPDARILYKSLGAIVSSQVAGRVATDANGNQRPQLCSECHHPSSGRPFSPALGSAIAPGDVIGGWTWSQYGGWADQFLGKASKPDYLKQAFQRWRDDGAQ